jgi:hypothetical protein
MHRELSEVAVKDTRWSRSLGTSCLYLNLFLRLVADEQLYVLLPNHEGEVTGVLIESQADYDAKIRGHKQCELQFYAVKVSKISL